MLLLLVGRSALLGEVHAGGAYPFEPAEQGQRAGEEGEEADQAAQGLYHGLHFVQFPAMLVLIV